MRAPTTIIYDNARTLRPTSLIAAMAFINNKSGSEIAKPALKKTTQELAYQSNKITSFLQYGLMTLMRVMGCDAEITVFVSGIPGKENAVRKRAYLNLFFLSIEQPSIKQEVVETSLHSRIDSVLISTIKRKKKFLLFRKKCGN